MKTYMKMKDTKHTVILCMVVLLLMTVSRAADVWPADNGGLWPTATPESQGMSSDSLKAAPSHMTVSAGTAILIRNGYDIWHYGNPYQRKTDWASCGRAMMTMMFGQMIMEGKITGGVQAVERPVNTINCAEAKIPGSCILLKHLLSYTSCSFPSFNESGSYTSCGSEPPGSTWIYHCNYFRMYRIVEQLDGRKPGIRLANIGKTIGANWDTSEFFSHNDPGGSPFLSINSTEAAAARWGYLWLKNGRWKENQIVDEEYVKRTIEPMSSPNGGYAHPYEGWQIHLNRDGAWSDIVPHDAYAALGAKTRLILVIPSLNIIYARSGPERGFGHIRVNGYRVTNIKPYIEHVVRAVLNDSTSNPTKILSPAKGSKLTEGNAVTLRGEGDNLSWSYDADSDGKGTMPIGTGAQVVFNVPGGVSSPRTITITLSGNGGVVSQTYSLADIPSIRSGKNGFEIDADYPGGNIIVERIEGDTAYIHQDISDTKGEWWFYWNFRVCGAAGRKLKFQFTNKNPIGVHGPAVSTDTGKNWSWLGAASVKGSSFSYSFAEDAGEVRFCFTMPYQQVDLQRFLKRHANNPNLLVKELCKTRKGRTVERLHLGRLQGEPTYRVLLTCRNHACETMASYVLEGILEAALAKTDDGRWFRENVEIMSVPFMDKDGVEDGDQGKNRKPHDHNRDYSGKSIYPSVRTIRQFVPKWSRGRLKVAFDLHCPGIRGTHNEVIYIVGSPYPAIWREQCKFAKVLETVLTGSLNYRAKDNLPFGTAWNTAKNYSAGKSCSRWTSELEGIRLGASFEIPYANADGQSVTAESARAFGRDLARAIRRYLEKTNSDTEQTISGRTGGLLLI